MSDGKFSWEGIDLIWVILGFLGSALGISRMPPMNKWQLFTALIAGVVISAMAPQVLILAWPTAPDVVKNITAFFFGIGGMFIVPGAVVFWQGFATDPWGWVTRILDLIDRVRRTPPARRDDDPDEPRKQP